MLKKILTAALAAMLLLSLTATALAAPDETAAPTTSPEATVSPDATASPAPTKEPNPFIEQVKAMRGEVNALRGLLKTEREYDRMVREQIKEIQGIVKLDKEQVATYNAERNTLTAKLKDLNKQLRNEKTKKPKDRDTAKIADLQAQIKAVNEEIAALKAKYQPLVDAIKGNKAGRRSLAPLRELLKPKYQALKPLVAAAKTLNNEIRSLTVHDLKDALKANDQVKANEAVTQIRAKVELLKENINSRIAIRLEMRKILDDYKAKLQTVTP